MIYPDVTLEEWLEKYPDLQSTTEEEEEMEELACCDNCGAPRKLARPFVDKDCVGIESEPCSCGKDNARSSKMIFKDDSKEAKFWEEIFEGVDSDY